MKNLLAIPGLILMVLTGLHPVRAQEQTHGIEYGGGVKLYEPYTLQTRTQYRDLGIGPYDVIPSGQTAISSLTVSPEGHIYGGTTGTTANLFVFFPGLNFVFPLGTVPGHESIHRSLAFGNDGKLYAGTGLDPGREYRVDKNLASGVNSSYESVTLQILEDYRNYEGGHIYRYDPAADRTGYHQRLFRIDKACPLEDLGIPVPNEGIHVLVRHEPSGMFYGLSYPGAYLFRFNPETRKTEIIKQTLSSMPLGNEMPMIPKVLVQDARGRLYCNTYGGYLLRYDPTENRLDTLTARLPGIRGRWVFNGLEAAVLHPGGMIYGGTTDGYLFGFDPETGEVLNYGKPVIESKIRTLTVGQDGNIYGIGGDDGNGMNRLFRFHTGNHTFCDLGIVQVSHVPYQEWTGLVFDTMVCGKDGSLFLGQSEYRSKLFIYNPR